jgi:hypothetical protein
MSTSADRLAATIADLLERVEKLERGPRLTRAAIDAAPLPIYDDDGQLRQVLGTHADGTYTTTDHNGPTPPTPTGVSVTADVEGVTVAWSGAADVELPADFERVAVHLSTVPGFTPTQATEVAAFTSPYGGIATVSAAAGTTQHVRLVMVSTSDAWSVATAPQAVTPLAAPRGTNWRGAWSALAAYAVDDAVTYDGSSYRRLVAGTSATAPDADPANWELIAAAGAEGPQGIPGPPGEDGQSLYTWLKYADSPTTGMSDDPTGKTYIGLAYNKTTATESSSYADYTWSLVQGPEGDQGVPGPPGADGQTLYTWIKYGTSATGADLSDDPTGKTYIGLAYNKTTATESTNAADYQWALIQGPQGPQGIPGPPGADGQSLYTWIKYADTPTTGMADDPTGKTYLGIAYNKTSSTESSSYADYQWSLIQGPEGDQGIQGPPGADGQPTYTWIKYGTSATGAGLSDDPTGKTHIGIAYNKTTPTESTNAADYEWSLIQGPQGPQGPAGTPAATIHLTATAQVLAVPAGGTTTTPASATVTGTAVNTTITVWEYSVDGSSTWTSTAPAGVSRSGNVVTITGSTMTARTIAVRMTNGSGVADTLTVAKVSDGATGATGPTGSTGAAGADAYTVLLTNEAHTFPGGTSAALAGSTTSTVVAYKGTTQQSATIGDITGQVTGLTTSLNNNGSTTAGFTVTVTTALTQQSGELTVPVTVDGRTFTKTFSWAVSRTGATGSTGPQGPAGLNWRGAWAAATAYQVNDAVTYQGASYRRIVAGTTAGNPKDDTGNWELLAGEAPPVTPTASPTPQTIGTVGALLLRLPPVFNTSPVEVDVYVSTSSPVPLTDTYKHGTATGATYVIKDLPAGHPAAGPLQANTTYHIVARSRNAAGVDPGVLTEVTGKPVPDAIPEGAFELLYAGTLNVTHLEGGTFNLTEGQVNVIEAVGLNGEKVGLSGLDGFYVIGPEEVDGQQGPTLVEFPVNGKPNIISGVLQAEHLTTQGAILHGTTEIGPGGSLVLSGDQQPPKTAPQVSHNWHTVQQPAATADEEHYGLTLGGDGRWYVTEIDYSIGVNMYVQAFNADGTFSQQWALNDDYYPTSVVYSWATGRFYVLAEEANFGNYYIITLDPVTLAAQNYQNVLDGGSTARLPTLGWDYTNSRLILAYVGSPSGEVQVQGFAEAAAVTDDVIPQSVVDTNFVYDYDLGFVARGSFDYAGDRYVVRRRTGSGQEFQVLTTAVPAVQQTAEQWPASGYTFGATWVGAPTASVTRTNGSDVITAASAVFSDAHVGAAVSGASLTGRRVVERLSATQVRLSSAAGSSGSGVATFTVNRFWSLDGSMRRKRYEGGRMMWTSGTADRDVEYTWHGTEVITPTVTTVNGSTTVNSAAPSIAPFTVYDVGAEISGPGIPAGATITAFNTPDQVTISAAAGIGAGTGTATITRHYETTPSPVYTLPAVPKRSRLTVTVGTIPVGAGAAYNADSARVYIAPAGGAYVREGTVLAPNTAWSLDSQVPAEGGSPPTSSSFPALEASDFRSTNGGVLIDSNGNGSVGTAGFRDSIRANGEYPGTIKMWGSDVIPPGWLLCDGSSKSRLTYADLFQNSPYAIGTKFGNGDNSGTTFSLPDFRGGMASGALSLVSGQGIGASNLASIGSGDTAAGQSARWDRLNHLHDHAAQGTLDTSTVAHVGRQNAPTGGAQNVVGQIAGTHDGNHRHNVTGRTADAMTSSRHGYTAVNFIIKT